MRTTTFDTANSKIIIDFGNGYELLHDNHLQIAYKLTNGVCIEKFSTKGMLLDTFTQIVENMDKSLS